MNRSPLRQTAAVLVGLAVLGACSDTDAASSSTTISVIENPTTEPAQTTSAPTSSAGDGGSTTTVPEGSTTTEEPATTTSTLPAPVEGPVYIVSDDLVVGWYEDGDWVMPDPSGTTAPPLAGVELRDLTGQVMGAVGADPTPGCFPEDDRANWQVELEGATLISGTHQLRPREVLETSPTPEYVELVQSIVDSTGAPATIEIDRVLRFDLEGDGVDEVLIEANSVDAGDPYDLNPGQYSVLLLRRIGPDGEVDNVVLHSEGAPAGDEFVYMTYFYIRGLADIDGDNTFELIASYSGFEWFGVDVVDLTGDTSNLLNAGCGV
ncbi:MAG: hypothetical protein R2770_07450 [Acidimicrobiales bacterium]|nr:hypothetical protein [Acidimicrobiales bacterium]